MLVRFEQIQGIGLLHNAQGAAHKCEKLTLVYADNGRGKSTIAAILRSAASGAPAPIDAFKTIDGTLPPKVVLQFENGHKVTFENGAWSEQRPEFLIFDADFIARNVHSGGQVGTDHRKNLLEFALGEPAVAARREVDAATEKARQASEKVRSCTDQLSGHHPGMPLSEFEQLPQVPNADAQIAALQTQISAARNILAIKARPVPQEIAEPSIDIDALFSALASSLDNVHQDAEALVRAHLAKLGAQDAEAWIGQGTTLAKDDTCPYCDQSIVENKLVRAYQAHFNAAYSALKTKIATLLSTFSASTAPNVIEGFENKAKTASAQAAAWAEQVPTQPIAFGAGAARASLRTLSEKIQGSLQKKSAAPAEALGTQEEKQEITALWQTTQEHFRATNAAIKAASGAITTYSKSLETIDIAKLQQDISRIQACKRRHEPAVTSLFVDLQNAKQAASVADTAKQTARSTLDTLMVSILATYQTSINTILSKFGAPFSIAELSANFRGNAPRSEYGILLRDKPVPLEGPPPTFTTALSDGDKRTLAFAFFIASVQNDPKIDDRIVIIDDPMCSLDKNRRFATLAQLKQIHADAHQLITLAHDAYFLRDLRNGVRKNDSNAATGQLALRATPLDYTDFAKLSLNKECESEYVQNHRTLSEYAAGHGGDPRTVAKTIRPLLEGYLHRRFPSLLPKDGMFGATVAAIKGAESTSPLAHAQNILKELNEINDYAGQFHHDTNQAPVPTELKGYVERALCLIHKGAPR